MTDLWVLVTMYLVVGVLAAAAENASVGALYRTRENVLIFICITVAWPYEVVLALGRWLERRRRR